MSSTILWPSLFPLATIFSRRKMMKCPLRCSRAFHSCTLGIDEIITCKISKHNTLFMICHNLCRQNLSLLVSYYCNRHVLVISQLMSTVIDTFLLSLLLLGRTKEWYEGRIGVGIWSGWIDMARQRDNEWRIGVGIRSALRIFYERANTLIFDFDSFCACV